MKVYNPPNHMRIVKDLCGKMGLVSYLFSKGIHKLRYYRTALMLLIY